MVERTFGCLNNSRRLSKGYDITTDSAETIIKISHLHTLLQETLNDMLTNTESPYHQADFQLKNNFQAEVKNAKNQDNFQLDFQEYFQLKAEVKNTEILAILKNQFEEKDKTIQALINVIGYEKNYQTTKLLAESNSNKNMDEQNPPPLNKKGLFTR